MARIRTHKPEFWTSEQVAECSLEARLLFLGLMNFADDGGRMTYSPKRIKGQIFPFDDFTSVDIQRMIDELSLSTHGEPMVALYEVEGKQYLQITGWDKHQVINRPTYQFPDRNGVMPGGKGFIVNKSRRAFHEPSTPEWNGMEEERRGRGKERKGGSLTRTPHARASPPEHLHDWPDDYRQQFADAYPHKVGMAAALKSLDNARGTVPWAIVLSALTTYIATKPPDRQWANPKTWIEQERWNDRPALQAANGRNVTDAELAAELAREAEERERRAQAAGGEIDRIGGTEIDIVDAVGAGAPGRRTG